MLGRLRGVVLGLRDRQMSGPRFQRNLGLRLEFGPEIVREGSLAGPDRQQVRQNEARDMEVDLQNGTEHDVWRGGKRKTELIDGILMEEVLEENTLGNSEIK